MEISNIWSAILASLLFIYLHEAQMTDYIPSSKLIFPPVYAPSVGIVSDGLWIDFAGAHVLNSECQSFTILYFLVDEWSDVCLLDLGVLGPDYLTSAVHWHRRLLTTQLQHIEMQQQHVQHTTIIKHDLNTSNNLVAKNTCRSDEKLKRDDWITQVYVKKLLQKRLPLLSTNRLNW